MEIHRFEKFWIIASLVLIVGYITTITYGAIGAGIGMVGDEGGMLENPASVTDNDNFREPGVYRTGENTFDVYVLARQFVYRPGTSEPIVLPAGSTATFYLASREVIHGFQLVDTNVNTMAIPGYVSKFKVRFNEARDYGLVCHEYCGTGHHLMEGSIRIVPPQEFEEMNS